MLAVRQAGDVRGIGIRPGIFKGICTPATGSTRSRLRYCGTIYISSINEHIHVIAELHGIHMKRNVVYAPGVPGNDSFEGTSYRNGSIGRRRIDPGNVNEARRQRAGWEVSKGKKRKYHGENAATEAMKNLLL
jgi:hypothetical protein